MKVNASKVGMVLVCTAALSAVVVNQVAQAQQRTQFAPITIFKSSRIASSDAGFRYAAAAVLSPVTGSPGDPSGFTAVDNSVYKDFFQQFVVSRPKVQDGSQMARLTPGQMAVAETLFTQTSLSAAKNLTIDGSGIAGRLAPSEVNMSANQIKLLTVQRLEAQIKTDNAALSELQR